MELNIVEQLKGLVEKIGELQMALIDAEAAGASIKQEAYEQGYKDGVASVPPVPEDMTPYAQADIDMAVAAAVEPLNMEIASLKEKVSELEVKLEAAPKEAVAAFKAEMLAKYEAQQASESDSEMALKDFLK